MQGSEADAAGRELSRMAGQIDILIDGGSIVTVDASRRVIRDGAVAIKDDKIVAVGKSAELRRTYAAARVYDATNTCVTPGFVNAHVHLYHAMHKNLPAESLCGLPWARVVHGSVASALTAEDEVWSARLTLIDALRSGATTFLDAGCHHVDALMAELPKLGMRGLVGRRAMDLLSHGHDAAVESTEACLSENERIMRDYANDGLVRPCVTIVGNGRCSDRLIVESKAMADRYGSILAMHHASHIENVNHELSLNGVRPTEHLAQLGVLGSNLVLTHVLHVTPAEISLLAESGTHVVHCPSSPMKVIYGLAQFGRMPELAFAGVNVALGTDPFDCGNDMLRAMSLAALTHKDYRFDPGAVTAEAILEKATINGAKALGLESQIGSLEVGKKADIAIFDMNRADWLPVHSEVRNLVYAAAGDSCESVIVDGRFVMDHRRITTEDEDEIVDRSESLAANLRMRSGLMGESRWPFV
jgi:5-methylthioadenosine/S-adenosylhomocysteine deaminase